MFHPVTEVLQDRIQLIVERNVELGQWRFWLEEDCEVSVTITVPTRELMERALWLISPSVHDAYLVDKERRLEREDLYGMPMPDGKCADDYATVAEYQADTAPRVDKDHYGRPLLDPTSPEWWAQHVADSECNS